MKTKQMFAIAAGLLACLLLPVSATEPVEIRMEQEWEPETAMLTTVEMQENITAAAGGIFDNITWNFDETTGTLTIGGTGEVPASTTDEPYPWSEYSNSAEHVVFEEGITEIPYGVLDYFIRMQTVALPSTLINVSVSNFIVGANNLQSITVTPGEKYYSEDGVLFSNVDGYYSLLLYPKAKSDTYYAVPNDVQCIEDNAFNSYYVQELSIPESVEDIHKHAIGGFVLTTITVDANNANYKSVDGVLYNKDMTLLHTYPLEKSETTFTVPDTVTEMTYTVFTRTLKLKELTIPASVETIWETNYLNNGCTVEAINVAADNPNYCSIDGVLYNKDVTYLIQYPIGRKNAAYTYTMPDTVTTIGAGLVFADGIETLYIGKNVTTVGDMLYAAKNLTSIYFPGDLPDWFERAFSDWQYNTDKLNRVTFYYPTSASGWTSPTMTISGYTYKTASYDPDTEEEIPWNTWNNIKWYFDEDTGTLTIGGEGAIPSVSYSEYPWRSVMSKTKVLVFEEGITSVPGIAISSTYNLIALSIPATMQTLAGDNPSVFASAYNLSNITAADGGTYYVQDGVLYTADTLVFYPVGKTNTTYTIPEGIVNIGAYAFPRNTSLTALTLPESLQNIGDNAMSLSNVTTLHIPKNVSGIHKYAFVCMDALTAYTVDNANPNYTAVDGILYTKDMTTLMAYPDNHPATALTVPNTVVEMDPAILHRSNNLKTLTLPASLTTIWTSRSSSGGCDLEAVIVDSTNRNFCSVDGVLYSKDMTTLYYYPANKADTEFHIPDAVTTLPSGSMWELRNLKTLYIGSGITTVQMQFSASLLEKIYFPGDLPSWFSRAFSNLQYYGMLDTLTFYYPAGNTTWTDGSMTISGVTYKTASYTRYTAGDLTGDGEITLADYVLLQDYFSGKDVTFDPTKADFNGDGKFTRADMMYLARALAKWAGYELKGSN